MNHDKPQTFPEKVKTAGVLITICITLATLVSSLVTYVIVNQLQPVSYRIDQVKAEADSIQKNLDKHESDQVDALKLLATKQQVDDLSKIVNNMQYQLNHFILK